MWGILYLILSIPENIVIDLNNVMTARHQTQDLFKSNWHWHLHHMYVLLTLDILINEYFGFLIEVTIREMGLKWLPFLPSPTSPRIWNTWLVRDGKQIQIEAILAHSWYLKFVVWISDSLSKGSFLCSLNGRICWLLSLWLFSYVKHMLQSLLKHKMPFWYLFLEPHQST